jgi:glycosyltransferase involved in cell wall biosynthesis
MMPRSKHWPFTGARWVSRSSKQFLPERHAQKRTFSRYVARVRLSGMKIAFDSWPLAPRFRCQGTYVYASNLIAEFRKAVARCAGLDFCVFAPRTRAEAAPFVEASPGFPVTRSILFDYERLWRLGGASLAGARVRADLMFSPSCNVIPLGKLPMVCTIHDVTPIVMPCRSRKMVLTQRFFLRAAAQRSRAIITVSDCSKQDLVERCHVPEEKVTVVHNGYDRRYFNEMPPDAEKLAQLRTRLGIQRHYILHHGVIQPRKNLKRLIEAYQLLLSRRKDVELDLILAGPLGWDYEQVFTAAAECSGKRGKVIFPGMLSDEDLAQLVKSAALVAIPSLYEGFCLPMVEAMACGVPAIVSGNSCFREISGNALLYFDPRSIEDIAANMERALFDSEVRSQIRTRGLRRAAHFSWDRCARETLEALFRAAGRSLSSEARA